MHSARPSFSSLSPFTGRDAPEAFDTTATAASSRTHTHERSEVGFTQMLARFLFYQTDWISTYDDDNSYNEFQPER